MLTAATPEYGGTQQKETDAEVLRKFVKSLPPGTILRHHIAGDIGKENKL